MSQMQKDAYFAAQVDIMVAIGTVRGLPLADFLETLAVAVAEATGPVLDPTLYRQTMKTAEEIKRVVGALRTFQRVLEETWPKPAKGAPPEVGLGLTAVGLLDPQIRAEAGIV